MADRPILFSADMVNAILAGKKTQTRRVARLTDAGHLKEPRGHRRWHPDDSDAVNACPYGRVGERLWVRETWAIGGDFTEPSRDAVCFRADGAVHEFWERKGARHLCGEAFKHSDPRPSRWRPSIFMPRWASRITLKVTSVRVERLQGISEDGAKAEGMAYLLEGTVVPRYVERFARLWDRINGKRPGCDWASNPWVWVVEFEREQADG